MAFWDIRHILNKIFDATNSRVNVGVAGGTVAHDAASTANPVLTGFVAESTTPTAVADGDLSQDAGTLYGARFVNLRTSSGSEIATVSGRMAAVPMDGSGNVAAGATGAAVPAGAVAMGASDGTNLDMLRAIDSIAADGITAPTSGNLSVAAFMFADNGTTKDRWRNNNKATGLVSAARTIQAETAVLRNYNHAGIQVVLNITVASGTGGLQVVILGIDPVTGTATYQLNTTPTAIVATGRYVYELYPGASTAGAAGANQVQQRTAASLPTEFMLRVLVGDASFYTYSLGHSLGL